MGRFEGDTRTIVDSLEHSDRQALNKQPQVDPHLRKTVLGKLLKWVGTSKSIKPRSFSPHELTPSGLPDEFIKALSQETGTRHDSKREETKRRKSAYSDAPSPRNPDPKSSLSSHVQVDLEAQKGPVKEVRHRLNTPHPVAKVPDTPEDIMRNKCDRYRLMYLVVRLEQQQEHVRDVIASIRSHSNKRDMKNMIKIKEALSKLYGTILSLRDDDVGAFLRIGTTPKDLDEFFNMVENVCSAVEDIPLEKHEIEGRSKAHREKQVMNATDCVRSVLHPGGAKPETASQGDENNSDVDESDGAYDVKTAWPALNTNDKGRQKKEKELRSLMQEIDMLMDDVGLTGADNKAVTFEELMAGVDMKKECTKEGRKQEIQKQEKQKQKGGKDKPNQEDANKFIEELDHLLDEAELQ